MKTAVESKDLNPTLSDLHNQGMTIIDIKLETARDMAGNTRTVYDIMYEEHQ